MITARTLFLALVAGLCAHAQKTFTIGGVVVQHSTKRPIAHALVTIAANDQPDQHASLKTSQDGRFTFTGVPKGKYTLSAEYHGFSQDYRQNESYSTGIAAGLGLDSEHIVFPLELPGSLSVRVLDESGEPVKNAEVVLFRRQVESGRAMVAQTNSVMSFANGFYRMANLTPGAYFVGVQGRPWYAPLWEMGAPAVGDGRERSDQEVVYPETYYPNTGNPDEAQPVEVKEGENTRIEFNLRPVRSLRVTVSGPGFDRSAPPEMQTTGNVNVMNIGPGGTAFMSSSTATTMDEHLLILGIAPGRHVISVSRWGEHGTPGMSEVLQTGPIELTSDYTLNTADIPQVSLSGRLVVEGGSLPTHQLILMMRGPNRFGNMTRIEKDGSFRFENPVTPGRYQPLLMNTNDLYIKNVAATGASMEAGALDIRGAARVELTITAAKGLTKTADGIATTGGQPTPGAMVLLVPDDPRYAGDFPRDQSDSDGTFTLRGIAPGRYRLVAIDDGRELEYRNSTVMKRYLAKAPQVEFPAAANTSLSVEVQKRQP